MKSYIISIIAMLFAVVGCHNHTTEKHEETQSSNEHEDEIVFTTKQAKAIGLATETVSPGVFYQVIKVSGQILSASNDETVITAMTAGVISFSGSAIAEGSPIKAGETIATISAKNLPDGDPLIKMQAAYETAQKEYLRAQNLIKDKIISEKEFEQIRLRYQTTKSAYQAGVNGVHISSPINGFVKKLSVSQGDYVSVGQTITTVSANKRLQLKAEVSSNYFDQLKTISSANFIPAYSQSVYRLTELNGKLLSIGKTAADASGYIPVVFEFDNDGSFASGAFAEVYLLASPQKDIISLSKTAITEEQGLYFVYIQIDEEGYQKCEVTLGQDNGERVEILSGLKVGERVVTKGAYQIKLAASSGAIPEGHSH